MVLMYFSPKEVKEISRMRCSFDLISTIFDHYEKILESLGIKTFSIVMLYSRDR